MGIGGEGRVAADLASSKLIACGSGVLFGNQSEGSAYRCASVERRQGQRWAKEHEGPKITTPNPSHRLPDKCYYLPGL